MDVAWDQWVPESVRQSSNDVSGRISCFPSFSKNILKKNELQELVSELNKDFEFEFYEWNKLVMKKFYLSVDKPGDTARTGLAWDLLGFRI